MQRFLFLILLLSFSSLGQNTGFYGKKTLFEVQGHGSWPMVANWLENSPYYKVSGSNLVIGKDRFDYGFRVGLMRAFSNMFGLGLEYSMDFQNCAASSEVELLVQTSSGFEYTNYIEVAHENIRLKTFTIMPKLEFSGRSNLLPIGLSHQVGVGYMRTSIVDRDYLFRLSPNNSNDSIITPLADGLVNLENVYSGFTVMYQINMRTPITERLVVSYGIRYNANFVRSVPLNDSLLGGSVTRNIKSKRNNSLINFNIGLGFVF